MAFVNFNEPKKMKIVILQRGERREIKDLAVRSVLVGQEGGEDAVVVSDSALVRGEVG